MLEPDATYEFAEAVEIMFPVAAGGPFRRWTGSDPVTFEGNVYSPGKLLGSSGITTPAEIGTDPASITIDTVLEVDRDLFIAADRGPVDAKLMYLWRKRPAGGAWTAWAIGAAHEGRLDIGTYSISQVAIDIQRIYDDVWRGRFLRWTATDQKRRLIPNPDFDSMQPESETNPKLVENGEDTGLDRADRIRRSGLAIATT